MQANEYNNLAIRTLNDHSEVEASKSNLIKLNSALGLCGESGEVADLIKKSVFHNHPVDRDKLLKEAGDVLWYLTILISSVGSNLEEVMIMNIDKLNKRYPNGFSSQDSINRIDYSDPVYDI